MTKRKAPSLSLVMIVKNERENLSRSLSSVREWVDEMIVVDTGSDDDTRELALDQGAKVTESPWEDDFSKPRNAGIEAAGSDWILQIDADEELVQGQETLGDILRDKYVWIYRVKGLSAPDAGSLERSKETVWVPRLFRRHADLRYRYPIHEHITCNDISRYSNSQLVINHFGPFMKSQDARSNRNLRLLEKAIEQYPDKVDFRFYVGMEYLARKQWEAALPYFEEAARASSSVGSLVVSAAERNLSWCLFKLERLEEAWQRLKAAQERYPGFTDLFYIEAQFLVRQGRSRDAASVLRRCLSMGDPPPEYWSWGGTGSWRAADHLEALTKFLEERGTSE